MMRAFQQGTPARHAESHPNPPPRNNGKTKQGKYMTEADAQKAGYRAAEK